MRIRNYVASLALSLFGTMIMQPAMAQQTAYAIANDGTTLIRFNTSSPDSVTVIGNFSGASTSLRGLDIRPVNNLLYGVSSTGGQVVTIDPNTAATTLISTLSTAPATSNFGIDFNPQVVLNGVLNDRLRVVEPTTNQNLRANANTGATLVDGTIRYAAGDPNENNDANVNEVAYLNSDNNIATPTKLYYIDYNLDILATTTAPNDGIITTVGQLLDTSGGALVDTNAFTGFDIFTMGGNNTAYAVLTTGNGPGLYNINLDTGAAALVGGINASGVYGLAVAQVPEPGAVALLMSASVIGVSFLRRRRSR